MSAQAEIKIFESSNELYMALAESIIRMTRESQQQHFDIALSGGNSPKGLFECIVKKYRDEIPWQRIRFWWGDERCVPPADEASNYKMTVDYLLSHIDIPAKNIHRVRGEEEPEKEAARYAAELRDALKSKGSEVVFDLIILGLGDDGHTASIFPDKLDLLDHPENCAVAEHPTSGQKRITLTGKVLNNADRIFFLVSGKNKAERVSEILNHRDVAKLLPAYFIAPKNGNLVWFLDRDAASLI